MTSEENEFQTIDTLARLEKSPARPLLSSRLLNFPETFWQKLFSLPTNGGSSQILSRAQNRPEIETGACQFTWEKTLIESIIKLSTSLESLDAFQEFQEFFLTQDLNSVKCRAFK